jgi:hypothetical protein
MGRISFLEFGQVFGELETKIQIKNYSPWCFHFFFGWVLPKAIQDRKGVLGRQFRSFKHFLMMRNSWVRKLICSFLSPLVTVPNKTNNHVFRDGHRECRAPGAGEG